MYRLQEEGAMEAIFQGRTRLLPTSRDLSFYNHQTQELACNNSPSFKVTSPFSPLSVLDRLLTPCHSNLVHGARGFCPAVKSHHQLFEETGFFSSAGMILCQSPFRSVHMNCWVNAIKILAAVSLHEAIVSRMIRGISTHRIVIPVRRHQPTLGFDGGNLAPLDLIPMQF